VGEAVGERAPEGVARAEAVDDLALDRLELELGVPRGPRGRVAWADWVVDRIVEELGGLDGPAAA
jgi:hypothetical protein